MDFQQFYIYYLTWLEVEVLNNQWKRKAVRKTFETINNKLTINKYNQVNQHIAFSSTFFSAHKFMISILLTCVSSRLTLRFSYITSAKSVFLVDQG